MSIGGSRTSASAGLHRSCSAKAAPAAALAALNELLEAAAQRIRDRAALLRAAAAAAAGGG